MDEYQLTDKKGQNKVVNQLEKLFSGYTYDITQHYIDANVVDIDMSVTGNTNNVYMYNIEAKDRNYTHYKFCGLWMIEKHKLDELLSRNGKSLYANTFTDDWLVIWDLKNIDISKLKSEWKLLPKDTQHPEFGKIRKYVYYLDVNEAVYSSSFI